MAEAACHKSLKLHAAVGNQDAVAMLYGKLGNVSEARGQLDRAEALYRKALQRCESQGLNECAALQHTSLGKVFMAHGELDRAEGAFRNSLQFYQDASARKGLPVNRYVAVKTNLAIQYGFLGQVCQARGEMEKSRSLYLKSLELYDTMENEEGMADQYENLLGICLSRGMLEKEQEQTYRKSIERLRQIGRRQMSWNFKLPSERREFYDAKKSLAGLKTRN
jgi:tetratricopeptide (TPR) repeat protein